MREGFSNRRAGDRRTWSHLEWRHLHPCWRPVLAAPSQGLQRGGSDAQELARRLPSRPVEKSSLSFVLCSSSTNDGQNAVPSRRDKWRPCQVMRQLHSERMTAIAPLVGPRAERDARPASGCAFRGTPSTQKQHNLMRLNRFAW
jgi:hypothetical protein